MGFKINPIVSFIFEAIKPFKWWIGGQFFVAIVWAVDLSLRPLILKTILNRMQGLERSQAYDLLLWPVIFYVSMSALVVLVFRFYDFVWLKLNHGLKRHLGILLMERMMLHSHSFYQNHFSGSLGNKVKDVMSGLPDLLSKIIDTFFSHILAILIAIATVWTVHIYFSIGLCVWIMCFMGISLFFSKKASILSHQAAQERSTFMGTIIDILGNMMSVRIFTNRENERKIIDHDLKAYVKADEKRDWFLLKMFAFQGGSFVIYQALCFFWLIEGFKNGSITTGDFALITMINIAIVNFLWNLSKAIGDFSKLLGDVTQGLEMALSPIEIQDIPGAKSLVVNSGKITFDKVEFSYKNTDPIFENKSITINKAEKVGLVGSSGGGKTTFVNLILRLYDVTSGKILIDDQDIRSVTGDSLRAAMSMIPQDHALFHRSLMENIRYGRPSATDDDVMTAAKSAHAHDFIRALPEGYHSLVGERGVKLSGGQRQRIAIARAILKNAPILILDEATSALDSVTERDIQESLATLMQNKTTIVIAHRLSTLLHMDRILVFDGGKIVEDGTHAELLEKNGVYKTLWSAQVGGFL